MAKKYAGTIADVVKGRFFQGTFEVRNGKIVNVQEDDSITESGIFVPGLVDAHVHIESSLLSPCEFARAATVSGTVSTVSDPHEIANVCGMDGVRWMLEDASQTPLKIFFGAPSCVPATTFETAGAEFGPKEIDELLSDDRIRYLSEVMNFPAVLHSDPDIMAIIDCARKRGKNIDGHAPGLKGKDVETYAAAGIETDHECVTLEEGRDRIKAGMKVAIREGSAARNFNALWPLLKESPESCFFCSDDKHPDDLILSHINAVVARAIAHGIKPMVALQTATINPVQHYGLPVGLLQEGDPADFIQVEDLNSFKVIETWIDGVSVAKNGEPLLPRSACRPINKFSTEPIRPSELTLTGDPTKPFAAIVAEDGQLITLREDVNPLYNGDLILPDPSQDLLKIAVVNRYQKAPPAVGLIRNFGLQTAAIAGSVAHDSHNIVAVGADDSLLADAINLVIEHRGGLSFASPDDTLVYPLPIAGLMGMGEAWEAGKAFKKLTHLAQNDGCQLYSPYMTLSFMALLVIPQLKIGDQGYFDVSQFKLVQPQV